MSKNISDIPYLKIMGKAFSLTYKNRYLWWFGFFTLLSNIASVDYSHSDLEKNHSWQSMAIIPPHTPWVLIGAIVFLAIIAIIIILSLISRGALISSIEKINKKQPATFKSSFRDGKKYLSKIFLISLFSGLFILGALIILTPPVAFLFLNHNYLIGILMTAVALVIFIPLLVLVTYLRIFGYLYAILGKLSPWASIETAYTLFRKNITTSLIMALLFIPINIIIFLIIFFSLIPVAVTILPLGIILFLLAGKIGAGIAGAIGLSFLALVFIGLRSFTEVFSQAAWILFFHEIASPEEKEFLAEPIVELETLSKPLPTINLETK